MLFGGIIALFIFPPGLNLTMAAVGYLLLKKSKRVAMFLLIGSFVSLFIFSTPFVAGSLTKSLQTEPAITQKQVNELSKANQENIAIVVLAGGRLRLSPEYGHIDSVSSSTLQRIQYAAWLHRKTDFPILVSGGSLYGESTPEAVLMNQTMTSAFNIAPKWIEYKSKNTEENAQFSAGILFENDVSEILLVTHAVHMPRAKAIFENFGFKVIAAPTGFDSSSSGWMSLLPSAKALHKSQLALHEKVGRLWYSIRY